MGSIMHDVAYWWYISRRGRLETLPPDYYKADAFSFAKTAVAFLCENGMDNNQSTSQNVAVLQLKERSPIVGYTRQLENCRTIVAHTIIAVRNKQRICRRHNEWRRVRCGRSACGRWYQQRCATSLLLMLLLPRCTAVMSFWEYNSSILLVYNHYEWSEFHSYTRIICVSCSYHLQSCFIDVRIDCNKSGSTVVSLFSNAIFQAMFGQASNGRWDGTRHYEVPSSSPCSIPKFFVSGILWSLAVRKRSTE